MKKADPWLFLSVPDLPADLESKMLCSWAQAHSVRAALDSRTVDALRTHFYNGCPSICLTGKTVAELLINPPPQSYIDGPELWG